MNLTLRVELLMPDLNEERNPAAEQTEVNPLKTTTGGFSFSDFIF